MSNQPFRYAGYEIDRKHMRDIEAEIRLYPIRKARLAFLKAKWVDRDAPDYHTYRSPQFDGMPGAPEKVGDPTANKVAEMATASAESQNIAYLEAWVSAMDMVIEERLDSLQRKIILEYVMILPRKREKSLLSAVADGYATQTQAYHWMNMALLEFAFMLLDEKHIRKISEIQGPKRVI